MNCACQAYVSVEKVKRKKKNKSPKFVNAQNVIFNYVF